MAPSIAQIVPETVEKPNIKAQEVKSDKVCAAFTFDRFFLSFFWWCQGPSYPLYFPYFDVNEKYPPLKLFGMLPFYSTVL